MAKRTTNTKAKRSGQAQAANRRRQSQMASAAAPEPENTGLGLSPAAHDILGVGLVVVAIAMLIALVSPTEAPVTRALGEAMQLGFGAGAWLVPVSLFVYAISFFVSRSDDKSSLVPNRIAAGLALIVIAILSILSCVTPVSPDPMSVFEHQILKSAGGYVGGGIAWLLLSGLGKQVALVVLAGVIVAGVVVCGFSISELFQRAQHKLDEAHQKRVQAQEARALGFDAQEQGHFGGAAGARGGLGGGFVADAVAASEEPATTYIGGRKTSVLQRKKSDAEPTNKLDRRSRAATIVATEPAAAGQTTRLDIDGALAQGAQDNSELETAQDLAAEPKTSLLKRGLFKRRNNSEYVADASVQDAAANTASGAPADKNVDLDSVTPGKGAIVTPVPEVVVPDFLQNAAHNAASAASAGQTKRRPTKRQGRSVRSSRQKAEQAGADAQAGAENGASSVAATGAATSAATSSASGATVSAPDVNARDEALPPMSILQANAQSGSTVSTDELASTAQALQKTLDDFGVSSRVVGWTAGPSVTTFQIEMGDGERVNKIRNLEDDIALGLAARSVRIFAPIPGTSYVGIEIPNKKTLAVYLGDVLPDVKGGPLQAAFGRDSEGKPVVVDIAALPHLLVAGTTGSGKSVLLNSIVMSMLMRATPKELRLIMVDPKRVEFTFYAGLPHLYVPVVTEPRQAASALQWSVTEMERRLKVFEHYKVRDIGSYNRAVESGKLSEMENPPDTMPFFVIVIDELSDLMMVAGKDVEASIVRIAQLGRAAGIHLIVATQRPSADVVTGLIKANIDNRVALSVDNSINSRIILDQTGAEKLLGRGDMLYKLRGKRPQRAQACFVSEAEVEETVDFIKEHHESDYHEDILSAVTPGNQAGAAGAGDLEPGDDPLVWDAAQVVVDSQLGSTSGLQRKLGVGFARAGRIMDMLEQKGVVGPQMGPKPREVLLDADGLEELRQATAQYKEV